MMIVIFVTPQGPNLIIITVIFYEEFNGYFQQLYFKPSSTLTTTFTFLHLDFVPWHICMPLEKLSFVPGLLHPGPPDLAHRPVSKG
jgi:hypothetical protein